MDSAREGFRSASGACHRRRQGRSTLQTQKARPEPGFREDAEEVPRDALARGQRARERTWKTSKLSSATCHQRYWSPRKAVIESIAFLKSGFFAEISL